MKIECVKETLAEAIAKAEKITGKNTTLPVLKCILLDADHSGLFIRATNLDLGIEIHIPAKVENPGRVAVPASTLNGFLSRLSNEKGVKIETYEGNLKILTPKTNSIIKVFPEDDYPSIPRVKSGMSFTISPEAFIRGLKSVWYSSATSSIKPELSSVRVYPEGDSIVFVATDGFRLAEKKIKTKNLPEFSYILIPVKNVMEIIRVFEGSNTDLKITIEPSQISIENEEVYLVSRTVEGNFPDYRAIIPKDFTTEAVILKQDISNILKLSTVFSDSFNHIKFIIHPISKEIELVSKNNDIGENSSKIVGAVSGDSLDINFNHRYLNDSFQALDSDSVSFSFSGANKPLVVRGVSDKTFLYLVMPMNR